MDQLPLELFELIIASSLDKWPQKTDPRRLEALRTVSRSWSAQIISSPHLWAVIHPTYTKKSHQLERLLERSRSAPLSVYAEGPCNEFEVDPNAVLHTAMAHTDRWRRLEISRLTQHAASPLIRPAPMLEAAVLGTDFNQNDLRIHPLFGGVAPRLRSLSTSLLSTLESIDQSILKRLEDLTITIPFYGDNKYRPRPVIPPALKTVTSCQNLRRLHIAFYDKDYPRHTLSDPIILPALELLRLRIDPKGLGHILSGLRGGPIQVYQIDELASSWSSATSPGFVYSTISPLIQHAPSLTVKLREPSLSLHSYEGDGPEVQLQAFGVLVKQPLLSAIAVSAALPRVRRVEILGSEWPSLEPLLWDRTGSERVPCMEELGLSKEVWEKEQRDGLKNLVKLLHAHCSDEANSACQTLQRIEVWERWSWVDRLGEVAGAAAAAGDAVEDTAQ